MIKIRIKIFFFLLFLCNILEVMLISLKSMVSFSGLWSIIIYFNFIGSQTSKKRKSSRDKSGSRSKSGKRKKLSIVVPKNHTSSKALKFGALTPSRIKDFINRSSGSANKLEVQKKAKRNSQMKLPSSYNRNVRFSKIEWSN